MFPGRLCSQRLALASHNSATNQLGPFLSLRGKHMEFLMEQIPGFSGARSVEASFASLRFVDTVLR